MKKELIGLFLISTMSFNSWMANASIAKAEIKDVLLQKYMSNYEKKEELAALKKLTLENGGKSVDALIEVMKNGKYPDKNRWMATFMLGQIMGTKSSPFISKFLKHPSWVMRMASLKTLLALKEERYSGDVAVLLNDDSLLVRGQALENIRILKAKQYAPMVWAMLYDKKNYSTPKINGKAIKHKRTSIIKDVIATVGELKFEKAKTPLAKMITKDKYNDIFPEMDVALSKITGKKSPDGDIKVKRVFWQREMLNTTIQ